MDVIVKAIEYGNDGVYPFLAGVESHHAVTLFAEKEGNVVTLYWNDPAAVNLRIKQKEHHAKLVREGKAKPDDYKPSLGRMLTREGLAGRIWDNATLQKDTPKLLYAGWLERQEKAGKDISKYKPEFDPDDPTHLYIVRSTRCFTSGIRIWQLFPPR